MSPNRFEATTTSKCLRPAHKIHGGGVDQQRFCFDVAIGFRNFLKYAVPQHHAEALGIRFGDRRDFSLLVASPRQVEGEPNDALYAVLCEYSRLDRHFLGMPPVNKSAHLRIFTLRVLSDHDHVHVARFKPF